MKFIIYNAGPLFTEYEISQRKLEGVKFRTLLEKNNVEYELGNPIDFPVNPTDEIAAQPIPAEIYEADASFIDRANIFFFDFANNDPGTMVELGMAVMKIRKGEEVWMYGINSDFRILSNSRLGYDSTIGLNSFMTGAIFKHGFNMYASFDQALATFCKDHNLNLIE